MADIKFKNMVTIVGNLKDFDLTLHNERLDKQTQEPYNSIEGTITIEVGNDDDVQVQTLRVFQRELTKKGAKQGSYAVYEQWLANREAAIGTPVRVNTNFSPNVFVSNDGDVIKSVQIQAGFLSTSQTGKPRSEFRADVLLTQPPVEETDREGELTGRAILNAEAFDFRKMAFPVKFILEMKGAIEYFESLDLASDNPVLLEVWGDAVNSSFDQTREVESAFGDPKIETITITRKENIITGASTEQKEIDEEIYKEIKAGKEAYEIFVSDAENRNQNKDNALTGSGAAKTATKKAPKSGGFDF